MKTVVLAFISLIGFYTIGRNNLYMLPGQVIWVSDSDLLYKVFLPLLMFIGGIVAIRNKDKNNYFYLSVCAMIIDAINRLSDIISNYYEYLTYVPPPVMKPSPDTITIIQTTNYLSSYIMLSVELILIFIVFKFIFNLRNLSLSSSS